MAAPINPSQVQWDDTSTPTAGSGTPPIDSSQVKWDDESSSNPSADLVNDATSKPAIGDTLADTAHEVGSSLYHSVVGGYKGLADLAWNKDPGEAADVINKEMSKTYISPNSTLKSVIQSKWNPLNYAQEAAHAAAEKTADWGWSPAISAGLESLPAALPLIGGAAKLAGSGVRAVSRAYIGEAPAAAEAATETGAAGNLSAAATAPDLSVAHPALRDAITQTKNPNQTALERHLDTAQLPLPEGEDPLGLRKGQATGDSQQISDEKNLRGDPDTQGILTNSIEDQDKKLVKSVGEIQRRANPDIVHRDNVEHDQTAIDAIKNQDNQMVLDTRAKYKALADANGGAVPIDGQAAMGDINQKLEKGFLTDTAQGNHVISSILKKLNSPDQMDFESFENARTRLAEVQRGGGSDAAAAHIVRDALENMPLSADAAHLKGLANTARESAKARFNIIDKNPAFASAIDDNGIRNPETGLHVIGASSPLAGKFLNNFALGDGPNATPAYINRLKDAVPDPSLSSSIEAASLNKLRDAAGVDPLGGGSFRNDSYRTALNKITPKANALFKPETIDNLQRLKRVGGYVNDEGKGGTTNRSNTAGTLQRFGAQYPVESEPTVKGQLLEHGADLATGHILGPVGMVGKRIATSVFKEKKQRQAKALAEQSVKDAKLKFATDATKTGAGLDHHPATPEMTPVARASGGRVDTDVLVNRLINRWKSAKRETDASTKPLLNASDNSIAKALEVAGNAI